MLWGAMWLGKTCLLLIQFDKHLRWEGGPEPLTWALGPTLDICPPHLERTAEVPRLRAALLWVPPSRSKTSGCAAWFLSPSSTTDGHPPPPHSVPLPLVLRSHADISYPPLGRMGIGKEAGN